MFILDLEKRFVDFPPKKKIAIYATSFDLGLFFTRLVMCLKRTATNSKCVAFNIFAIQFTNSRFQCKTDTLNIYLSAKICLNDEVFSQKCM